MPERIQLRRTKGWRKPEGVIIVARPSIWGNPWTVIRDGHEYSAAGPGIFSPPDEDPRIAHQDAVDMYIQWLDQDVWVQDEVRQEMQQRRLRIIDNLGDLGGRDLACWCPSHLACHADVLLELANQEALGVTRDR